MFLSITGQRGKWFVQPCWHYKTGWWKYGKAVDGPFKTKREAREAKATRSYIW